MKKEKEKKIKKERPVKQKQRSILPGAILMALVVSVIIFAVMLNAEKNALSDYEKGYIYVAAANIPKGQLISEDNINAYFVQKELDKNLIPEAALSSPEQVYGLLSLVNIDPGTLLVSGLFEDMDEITGSMKEPVVAGFKAEDLFQVVSGILRAGDRIHIYIVDKETQEAALAWQNIFVQQVFDTAGSVIESSDTVTAAQRVNILLEKDSTEAFYSMLSSGELRVVKVVD